MGGELGGQTNKKNKQNKKNKTSAAAVSCSTGEDDLDVNGEAAPASSGSVSSTPRLSFLSPPAVASFSARASACGTKVETFARAVLTSRLIFIDSEIPLSRDQLHPARL